jgi:colanic acid biosynthesis glycosyl transferase WcaI
MPTYAFSAVVWRRIRQQMVTKDNPLSVLVVSQYFSPEAFGVNGLVAELQERGHTVTVLTGMPNYPSGVFFDGYGGWKVHRETWKNASVIRIPIFARGQDSRFRLALNYLSFAINASILAPFVVKRRPDVILVYQMSPVTMALPAIIVRLFTRSKILLWVQDIWPESLVATGAVKSPMALVMLRLMVRMVYRRSSVIAVQSRQFEKFIRPLAPPASDIRYLPNTADRFYRPLEVSLDAPERKLFRPGFNILFAGNLGLAQDLETLLAAITHLKDRKDIQWVFVGDGRRRAWLEQQVQQQALGDNVQVLGPFSPEKMPLFFAIADVLLITLRDEPIFSLTVPSKLQTYLACGRPILGAISGESANILMAAGAGLTAPPNDPERLAEIALTMAQMPHERLKALGEAALEYQQREFDRDHWLARIESWLQELSSRRSTS